MKKYCIAFSDIAKQDALEIAKYTQSRYGPRQADAYENVIRSAIESVREDPFRPGSRDRSEDLKQPGLRSYHTALSNDPAETNVKTPRHLIFYSEPKDDIVTVNRIIHETRDVERHLSPDRPLRQVYKAKAPTKDQDRER